MSNEERNKRVPRLRFAEFKDSVDWDEKKLGDIGEPLMCKRIFKEQTTNTAKNGIPFYKIGTFGKVADSFISIELYKEFKSKYSFPKNGDILISAAGTIGRLVIYDGSPSYFQDSNIVWLGNNEELVLNRFLFNSYSKMKWQTSDGGIISRLYNSDLKNMKILFPKEKEEQQKIADCLSSLDELITAQSQKLQALKAHKKGLMQQLFPAEGDASTGSARLPQLRFAAFRDSGEWEEKTLSQVAHYENGKAHEQDIVERGDFIVVNSKFISSDGEVKKFTNAAFCLAQEGDILMVLSDVPNGKAIAKCFFVGANNLYSVNQRICKLTPFDADNVMLFYILNRNSYFLSFDDGVKQTNLRNEDVLNFQFLLPHDPEEQQKIADCLSSLDELITAQAEKIEALKAHKKGLMQGLFPQAPENL